MSTPVVYISIGNSDDKLTQAQWADFYRRVKYAVDVASEYRGAQIHGAWLSGPADPWQNACWALQLPDDLGVTSNLRATLSRLASEFKQDSIAWALAEQTTFIPAEAA